MKLRIEIFYSQMFLQPGNAFVIQNTTLVLGNKAELMRLGLIGMQVENQKIKACPYLYVNLK